MIDINILIKNIDVFYNDIKLDNNSRYKSWEHCYSCFYNAKNNNIDYDYLALNLAFYLASWGMYRGSSFLLQQDYKIHTNAVKIILNKKYNVLCGITIDKLEKNIDLLFSLVDELSNYYNEIRKQVYRKNNKDISLKNDISSTLITKILLGTLGCVPAYDRYFKTALKYTNIANFNFNKKSILQLINFYKANKNYFYNLQNIYKINNIPYPEMKLLDMIFWQYGLNLEKNK